MSTACVNVWRLGLCGPLCLCPLLTSVPLSQTNVSEGCLKFPFSSRIESPPSQLSITRAYTDRKSVSKRISPAAF